MAKTLYEDRKETMDFKDSWMQNTVELAALGAIVAGAGNIAIHGNAGSITKGIKNVSGAMGKGFDNYMRRHGSQASRFGYQVGKKTFRNLNRMPRRTGDEQRELITDLVTDKLKFIQEDPATQDRIRKEVVRRLGNEGNRNLVDDVLDGTNKMQNSDKKRRALEIYNKIQDEELKKQTNRVIDPQPAAKKPRWFGRDPKDTSPMFDRKEMTRNMVGSGLAGVAFGGGLTGVHALDRTLSNKDNQKKVEDSFSYVGSFLPETKKEDQRMRKEAGSLETFNRLKEIGRKTPEAVATGIGFTGVSLGAAKMLNDKKKKEEEAKPKSTRVIIELGNEDGASQDDMSMATPHPLRSLPKIAHLSEPSNLAKMASGKMGPSQKLSENWLRSFVNDLKGHKAEIGELKKINHQDVAANALKDADVDGIVKQKYGNLVNDGTQSHFTKKLFDEKATESQRGVDDQIKKLQTREADAKLRVGAGVIGVGGGLAGLASMRRKDDDHGQPTS